MLTIPNFADNVIDAIRAKKSFLVAGLDPQLRYMPVFMRQDARRADGPSFEAVARLFLAYNMKIIDAVIDYVVAVKLQVAFYECYGHWGLWAHEETLKYARLQGLIAFTDGKRNDGGDTAEAYADGHIGEVPFWSIDGSDELSRIQSPIRADALTVTPYIGDTCINPFIARVKKYGTAIFVVDKTSFVPNSRVEELFTASGLKVWQEVALMTHEWGEGTEGKYGYRNVGVVLGATKSEDAPWMRRHIPMSWKLLPGVGGQNATPDDVAHAINDDGLGGFANDSRNLMYAYLRSPQFKRDERQFDSAAHEYAKWQCGELNAALKRANKHHF